MSESEISVTASTQITRAIADVRRHFFDLDHAVRDRLHERVRLSWIPGHAKGERRLKRHTRVLGRDIVDELLVTQEDDGTIVARVVGGPNEGMVVREEFSEVSANVTAVEAIATIPSRAFNWAVGPIVRSAVRRMLERSLDEHKRDLEGGGYQPGRARGRMKFALSLLAPIQARTAKLVTPAERIAIVAPLIEAACLTAIADDDADDAERDAIKEMVHMLGIAALDDDAIEALIASSIDRARETGLEKRCDELGARLRARDIGEAGIVVAGIVAQVSCGVDQSELALLQRLAEGADVPMDRLVELLAEVDAKLGHAT